MRANDAAPDPTVVRAQDLAKRFPGRGTVFHGLDLTLAGGTLTHLAGANGCGKTTLLRLLAGVSRPNAGRIEPKRRRCAIVPERFRPPATMTPVAYLAHIARLHGIAPETATRQATELLERLAVQAPARAKLGGLSKGTAQKVAVAQAFMAPTDLLLLDEPCAGLDTAAAGVLDALIRATTRGGAAVLIVEHGISHVPWADAWIRFEPAGGGEARLVPDTAPAAASGTEPTASATGHATVTLSERWDVVRSGGDPSDSPRPAGERGRQP